jgi:hypothetical protein
VAKTKVLSFKFSSSYPGGGEPWEGPAAVVDHPNYVVLPISKAGYVFDWDGAAKKIRAFRQSAATGALTEPTGVDLSSTPGTIVVLVIPAG